MARRRQVAAYAGIAIAAVLALLLVGVLLVTQTPWGRDQVRSFALERLAGATDGRIEIGRIEGNLLRRVRLVDVTIVDQQERPFLRADTITTRFSLWGLLRRQVVLTDMRLVRPIVVLDQPPGEEWNYVRIFRIDPDPDTVVTRQPGWGSWVALRDVEIINGRITVRTEWRPADDLAPAERERAVQQALAGETRENVVQVSGGYQNVMDFRDLNSVLPRVIVAHPDSAGIPVEIARFSGTVQPFAPPAAVVQDLAGKLRLEKDSLHFADVTAVLPGSRLSAAGVYALQSGDLLVNLRGRPLSFPDMRWLYPPLPEAGGGDMDVRVERRALATRVVATNVDARVGAATIAGRLDVTTGDTVRLGPTDLEFSRAGTALVRRFIPALDFPRPGELTGRLALRGPAAALQLDGDVRFDDARGGGSSRVVAAGELGVGAETRFRDLRLRFQPLQSSLARAVVPELPLTGTIEGFANLTGTLGGLLQLDSDLTLRDARTGVSRVRATGGVDQRGELRLRDMLVRVDPLRAELVRPHVPQLPQGAVLVGRARLDGYPSRALRVDGDMEVRDPATGVSRIGATGSIAFADELRLNSLELRMDPLRLDLLRDRVPDLPAGATMTGQVVADGVPARALRLDGDVVLDDPRTGRSRFGVTGGLVVEPELRFDDMRFRLQSVQMALLQERVPELPGGTVMGDVRVDGPPSGMLRLDGTLRHEEAQLGRSEVEVHGGLAAGEGVRFDDLALQLRPLSMRLVQSFMPDLPIGGTLAGTATLNGSTATRIAVDGDLVHVERGERSRVTGRGVVAVGDAGSASVDVSLRPLSLVTAGRFAPAAGLRGSVTGDLRASGDLSALRVDADLRVAGGGAVRADGTVDLVSDQTGYELDMRMSDFNLAAVTWRAPAVTALTGTARASGRGMEPATMRATIAADLVDSEVDGVGADRVRLRLGIEQGLATVDSSVVRLGTAVAVADGSFGLVAGRHGTLNYRVEVDSLHWFAPWVPGADTAVARPAVAAAAPPIAADTAAPGVAADTARVTGGIAVADAVLGADSAMVRGAAGDSAPVPADSLAGRLRAEGTLRGSVAAFDASGSVEVEDLVYGGTRVGRGAAEYEVLGAMTERPDVTLSARAGDVVAAGRAFDRLTVDGEYQGGRYGTGRVSVMAVQDPDTDYRLDAEFALSLERNELRLADARLRFDTVTWQTVRPGVVSWGEGGVEVAGLELVSSDGGRIAAEGTLPAEGAADLRLQVENLEVGQLADLAQSELAVAGRLDLDAFVEGTRGAPLMRGTATLQQATVDGNDAPDVRAEFEYADLQLTAVATLVHEDRLLATADARLPVDLRLTGDVTQRLLGGEIAVDVQADSIPIEAIPFVSEQVDDARGRIAGSISVRGTFDAPVLDGTVNLDLGSVTVVPLGVRFDEISGTLSLAGTTLTVDSLVARSGGPIRVSGDVDVSDPGDPGFDLTVDAENALVIDREEVRMRVDAELTVEGPLSAVAVEGNAYGRSGMLRIPTLSELGSGDIVNLDDPATYERSDSLFLAERDRLFPRRTLDNLRVDVGLILDRDVWLRSAEANVEIYTPPEVGPLRIVMDGPDDRLTLLGTINTDRGVYEFMSRRFNLTRGAVTFTGEAELNPYLQIAAEHEVRMPGREAFHIRVVIGGTLQDFSLTLESTSQPPISQTDLLSYLAFGRDASSLLARQGSALTGQGEGAGGLVGNVAGLATQQMAAVALEAIVNDIEAEALRELRLDVFRITPADLPAEMFTGSYLDVLRGTEIEAGRYISPRLFLAAQARAGLNRPGIRMEYWTPQGFQWHASLQPRFLPREPTLTEQDLRRGNVFGAFLFREWRF